VVKAVREMAEHYGLDETENVIVMTAAWFHDTGHLVAPTEGHEEKSIELATAFLRDQGIQQETIAAVQGCIKATHMPQMPKNLLEEMVCDADLFHLGWVEYLEKNKLLREENQLVSGKKISGKKWRKNNVDFLQNHHYFTSYAQLLLNKGKEHNLHHLKKQQAKKDKQKEEELRDSSGENYKDKSEKKEKKQNKLDRDVSTMFRITSSNHINLGEMADRKSRIMISVNSILVSVIVSLLIRRLHENYYLIIPTILFLVTGVVTIIFSVLAARPTAGHGTFEKEDIEQKKGNLLYFGNFYKMKLEEYKDGIKSLMNDRDFLYGSLTEDIYRMGVLLGRKYKLLRIAYNVFMIGFALAVAAYIIVIVLFQ
jgi:predicted metal-dependent HD superfamily phosphohydrolase